MAERDVLEALIEKLQDPEFQSSIEKLVMLLDNMNKSGLLDLLVTVTDPDVIDRLMEILITTGTMKLLDNLDTLLDKAGDMVDAMTQPAEPVSISKLLAELSKPEVAKGLGKLIKVLEALGKD
ncbi:MAG: DUF1641 domain-containing protein [Desulfurococcales archaeon]|nr:DUF1641 domain-containing protein [Desulfurococcales archaeon]